MNVVLDVFQLWRQFNRSLICDGRLHFHSACALLTGAVINRDRCQGAGAAGGEPIESVLLQKELDEYYNDFSGCFELPCNGANLRNIQFAGVLNPLNMWLKGMYTNGSVSPSIDHVENRFTVAITRFDYANMYFVINDWYHVYLMARFFKRPPEETRVLLIDAHPRGAFDDSWSVLFGGSEAPVLLLSQLPPGRTLFAGGLAWSMMGPGPLSKPTSYAFDPPLIDDFHRFVVARHGLPEPDDRRLDCSNISVLFLWRHDYLAHPRNPKGVVKVSSSGHMTASDVDEAVRRRQRRD
jgi:glycoprotein 2-beta-D-xylosyltransferase